MHVEPYFFFDGCCEEAIKFYQQAIGAKVEMLVRFKDCRESEAPRHFPAELDNKVMHARLRIGGTTVLASDGRCQGKPIFAGFSLSISVSSESEADRMFAAVTDGGKVTMPLDKTFFSPRFGMGTDRFGVSWMILVQ